METWRKQMPKGMFLKSEGFASSLSDREGSFTLAHYCTANAVEYADIGSPVKLETFSNYGVEFHKRKVAHLEDTNVARLERLGDHYQLTLDNGEEVLARRVVVATGISHYAFVPSEFDNAPADLVSHAAQQSDPSVFKGQEVVVLGGGASALDMAALLVNSGASVHLVVRKNKVHFQGPPFKQPRPLLDRLKAPMSGLGPGWRSRLCTDLPLIFYAMPKWFRLKVVSKHLGPAATWWTKNQVVGKAEFHLGTRIQKAEFEHQKVTLDVVEGDGTQRKISANHVIAATGYKVDLKKLPFLNDSLRHSIKDTEGWPILSPSFESSAPGLYFVGISSALSFGPMMRFAFGATYTAHKLSRHLARKSKIKHNPDFRSSVQPARSTAEA